MKGTYSPGTLRRYYDEFAEREWERLEKDLRGRISYLIHRRFLLAHATAGARALDIGCGPGRFAIDMLRAGLRVTLADLSPVMVAEAQQRIAGADLSSGVDQAAVADVCDLAPFPEGSFDLVVAFGGVLSYTCEQHLRALDELIRVTREDGIILMSLMPLGGTMRLIPPLDAAGFLEHWDSHMSWDPSTRRPGFVLTVPGSPEWHQPIALFTADYLRGLLTTRGCQLLTLAAANPVSALFPMPNVEASPLAVERLVELELALCDSPALAESGSHMIVVARKGAHSG